MGVIIGVDPHKASCTAAVLDERGELVDQQRFASTRTGSRALGRWAKRWPERCWAVEGASGLGRGLAQQLVSDGEPVLDVPAKLAARVRLLSTGHGRKSDAHDAVSVAVAALGARRLGEVRIDDHASVLRLLSDRRDDLVRQRTQTLTGSMCCCATCSQAAPSATSMPPSRLRCCAGYDQPPRRPAPAGSSPSTWSPTSAPWTGGSQRSRNASAKPSTGQRPPSSSCSGSAHPGRQAPGRGRRHRPVPDQAPLRCPQRHRPHRGLQR
jgi:transposase